MEEILRQKFIKTVEDFTAMTGIYLPDDVEVRLREMAQQESIDHAKTMYDCMIDPGLTLRGPYFMSVEYMFTDSPYE